jgi:hypothetical protein
MPPMHPRIFLLLLIAACMPLPSAAESAPPLRGWPRSTPRSTTMPPAAVRRLETGDDTPARSPPCCNACARTWCCSMSSITTPVTMPPTCSSSVISKRRNRSAAPHYPYRYLAPVNTGVPSGLDLDGDGRGDGPGDAWGFGRHPGQYGMLVLSRYPIDAALVRSSGSCRGARCRMRGVRSIPPPAGWHADATWRQLRLSSKSHWDVPVLTPAGTLHFLVAHPTPPVFDGPEDRNGARNADEIGFWKHYLSDDGASPDGNTATWLCDDAGRCGGLPAQARFVIAGDMNSDPADGDGRHDAIIGLLEHPRVLRAPTPASEGGADAARALCRCRPRPSRRAGPRHRRFRAAYRRTAAGLRAAVHRPGRRRQWRVLAAHRRSRRRPECRQRPPSGMGGSAAGTRLKPGPQSAANAGKSACTGARQGRRQGPEHMAQTEPFRRNSCVMPRQPYRAPAELQGSP